jgi:hypothetical protein
VVRLKEVVGFREPYITLSHGWGSDSTKVPIIKLGTYEAGTRKFPWEELSRTCQDTIRFSRMIGFRFIWIDPLCIIQYSSAKGTLRDFQKGVENLRSHAQH